MTRKSTLVLLLCVGMLEIAEGSDQKSLSHEERVLIQVSEGLNLAGGVKAAVS